MLKSLFFLLIICCSKPLHAQNIRVETFIGTEAPVLDVFWLKRVAKNSQFLFLSRNTYSIPEYKEGTDQFSTLNILAYQIKKTGFGFAVAATARTNSSFQARSGIQFLKVKPNEWLLYTIISSKLGEQADVRWLTIFQFTPKINENWQLFTRAEWVSSVGFTDAHRFSSGMVRIGLQRSKWQFGLGSDFLWLGKDFKGTDTNYGIFLTHLF
ncbi:hypothetical protein [Polaribacter porphyrae]|uniref:Uncharacterized protein n=1 Tax=Polaribacter porphyrae TaxID=1137780 RepID=A0A2S7WNZ2_9FLAO|nr:hypothetical protein [Polaribacter porphyrae]PQJ78991.1 hypothetical protein BTO18_07295 [Polaribacter porphyrae]